MYKKIAFTTSILISVLLISACTIMPSRLSEVFEEDSNYSCLSYNPTNQCFLQKAKEYGDLGLCEKITNSITKNICIELVAEKLEDPKICDSIQEKTGYCKYITLEATSTLDDCFGIINSIEDLRDQCLRDFFSRENVSGESCNSLTDTKKQYHCMAFVTEFAEETKKPALCKGNMDTYGYCRYIYAIEQNDIWQCQKVIEDKEFFFRKGHQYYQNLCYYELAKKTGGSLSLCNIIKEQSEEEYNQCIYAVNIFSQNLGEEHEDCKKKSWRSAKCQFFLIKQSDDVASCVTLSTIGDKLSYNKYQNEECFAYFAEKEGLYGEICDTLEGEIADVCDRSLERYAEFRRSPEFCEGTKKDTYYCQCPNPPIFTKLKYSASVLSEFPLNDLDARYIIDISPGKGGVFSWNDQRTYYIKYIKNNEVQGEALISPRSSINNKDSKYVSLYSLSHFIGKDVQVTGFFKEDTYKSSYNCGPACPSEYKRFALFIDDIESHIMPFRLDDPLGTYTIIKNPVINHGYDLVYDDHNDIPYRVNITRRINNEIVGTYNTNIGDYVCKDILIQKGEFYCSAQDSSNDELMEYREGEGVFYKNGRICEEQTIILIDNIVIKE